MHTRKLLTSALHRLLAFALSVLLLSFLVFVIARLAPGDPLVSYYGERAEKMTPAQRAHGGCLAEIKAV